MTHGRTWALALVLLCAVFGCAKDKRDTSKPSKVTPQLEVFAFGDEVSNGGYAMQLVIRAVEEPDFIEDSYSDIAALVSRPDETVLGVMTVFPGDVSSKTITLEELPAMIGIYGLFNDIHDGEWKLLLRPRPANELGMAGGAYVIEIATDERSVREMHEP